jgi:hypothetical protein
MPLPKEDIEQIRRERIERARDPFEHHSIDAVVDLFADLTDEFTAEALPPFVDAMERMEALLEGRGELFSGEIGADVIPLARLMTRAGVLPIDAPSPCAIPPAGQSLDPLIPIACPDGRPQLGLSVPKCFRQWEHHLFTRSAWHP